MRLDLLIIGGIALASGLPMALNPRVTRIKNERARTDRLAQIDAGQQESYFEERRALVAYSPPRADFKTGFLGTVSSLSGAILIVFAFLN